LPFEKERKKEEKRLVKKEKMVACSTFLILRPPAA
jgi:hypothetical protein